MLRRVDAFGTKRYEELMLRTLESNAARGTTWRNAMATSKRAPAKLGSMIALALLLVACPPADDKAKSTTIDGCSRVGQTCEVSPGKLGTCVVKDGCADAGAACFVCQSQH